jgi:cell division protein FtsB
MAAIQRPALPFPRPFSKPAPARVLLVAACGLLILAAGFQVNRYSRVTTTGYELNDLNRVRAQMQAENHEIEAEVAQLSSLARVDWEARTRLQMVPATKTLYIEVNHPVPVDQAIPTRFLPAESPDLFTEQEPLWRRLLRLLPF